MADRYWVGGAGTWDATTTTNWSATSGGASGASAPTSVDNVIFNASSNATAYAVTVGTSANALDVTIAGPAVGNVTITMGATAVLNCYGSWLNAATGVAFNNTNGSIINYSAITTGKTITTNNITLSTVIFVTKGIGGGWTLGSALTLGGTISIENGTFNTGNFAITSPVMQSSGTSTRALTLGTSTITLSNNTSWVFSTTTGLTFSGALSTIIFSATSPIFAGGGLTYGTVNFTSTSSGTSIISGVNTFTTLTQVTQITGRRIFALSNNQTITGTLTLGATNSYNFRIQCISDSSLAVRTFTVGTVATLSDVDFRNIAVTGASAPWSGTRLGNGTGNSGITFAAGVNKYWNLAAGGNWSANAWALTSGGATATNNFPLAQDTVIIENTGLTAGNTITIDLAWWIGSLTSTRTNNWTLASTTQSPQFFGNITLTTGTTVTGTGTFNFSNISGTQTITTAGVTLSQALTFDTSTGSVVLNGDLTTASTQTTTLNTGTLNLAGFTLSTGIFSSSNSNIRTLAFGTGKIVLTGSATTLFTTSTATNLTVTGTNPLIELTTNATTGTRTVTLGATTEANAISVDVTAGSDAIALGTTSGAFKNVNFTGFTGSYTTTNGINIYGNWNWGGVTTNSSTATITFAATSGTKTITSNGKSFGGNVTFNGVGGTWLCADALTTTSALTLTNGTLKLAAGTTSTVGSFVTSGTNPKYLQSSTDGTQATISDASGTNTVSYLTIQDSNATGGAIFDALAITNVDAGNNTGWLFSTTPSIDNEITMRLRSFTQPRRF
jgi:hypothetical protein